MKSLPLIFCPCATRGPMTGLFAASLQTPVSPSLVGQKILDIMERNRAPLRYPVGPNAEPSPCMARRHA